MINLYLEFDEKNNKYYLGLKKRKIQINQMEYSDLCVLFDLAKLGIKQIDKNNDFKKYIKVEM